MKNILKFTKIFVENRYYFEKLLDNNINGLAWSATRMASYCFVGNLISRKLCSLSEELA